MSKVQHWTAATLLTLACMGMAQAQDGEAPSDAEAAATDPLTLAITTRSAEDQARDTYRHPAQTLEFFQVQPGMTVAEALPGGGWYTRIIANYLGSSGTLYGVNYVDRMWPLFSFMNEDMIADRIASTKAFPGQVKNFTDNGIKARGFTFSTVHPEAIGQVDRVLMIRALHNLNRFESQAGTLSQALAGVRSMLKDDGFVGVVQHRLPESQSDEKADGSRGYLKESAVVAMFKSAGFELVAASDINANPKDKPGPDDFVWRLPPSLNGSGDDPEMRAAMLAIGESDRMTLLFRKSD
ncbi:MAG: methyltransferase [Pseudomonadota bacterium]